MSVFMLLNCIADFRDTAAPGIARWKIESVSTGAVTGVITELPSDSDLAAIRPVYRKLGTGLDSWTADDDLESPVAGSSFTIEGLDADEFYEVSVLAVDSAGNEGDPGDVRRIRPAGGSTVGAVLDAVASEMLGWIDSPNVRVGESFEGKVRTGDRAALVSAPKVSGERRYNGARTEVVTVKVTLLYGSRDSTDKNVELITLAEEVARHFDGNAGAFDSVDGFLDVRSRRSGAASGKGEWTLSTDVIVECLLEA